MWTIQKEWRVCCNLRSDWLSVLTAFLWGVRYTFREKGAGGVPVYAAFMAVFNFGVDYMLLAGTCQLMGKQEKQWRILIAAAIGGLYAGFCFVGGFRFLLKAYWRTAALAVMCCAAFALEDGFVNNSSVFVLLNLAMDGIAAMIDNKEVIGSVMSLAVLLIISGFIRAVSDREGQFVPVEIRSGSRKVQLTALYDTGNGLKDPITGEEVMIIGKNEAKKLTGLTEHDLCHPLETMKEKFLPGLRLIPFRTIGNSNGLMLGMKYKNVFLNGKKKTTVIAFSSDEIGGSQFQAITGGIMR